MARALQPRCVLSCTCFVIGLSLLVGPLVVPAVAQDDDPDLAELDVFMERVLERRDENWITLQQYVLDERETFEVVGPLDLRLQSFDREFSWYEQDGFLIRSPVRFDGVDIGETERREYEAEWLREERRRSALPPEERNRPRSRRSAFDNIMLSIEREWGRRVSDDLGRTVADDARRRGDGFAAMVVATDAIVTDMGGVDVVGLDMVLARTRDGFVMLETHRLDGDEVMDMLDTMLDRLAPHLGTASSEQLDAFVELVQLAARFGLDIGRLDPGVSEAERALAVRGDTERVAALERARRIPETESGSDRATASDEAARVAQSGLQPRFLSEAYFLDAPFEPGNYYVAGRDELEGKDVIMIEYYPEPTYGDGDQSVESADPEDRIIAGFDKTSLITLWIDPDEHQIVKFTFDNVGFDFLPGRWLVRVDDLTASMVMGQFLDGVWLPASIEFEGEVTLATGTYTARYTRVFMNYRKAEARSRVLADETSLDPR